MQHWGHAGGTGLHGAMHWFAQGNATNPWQSWNAAWGQATTSRPPCYALQQATSSGQPPPAQGHGDNPQPHGDLGGGTQSTRQDPRAPGGPFPESDEGVGEGEGKK